MNGYFLTALGLSLEKSVGDGVPSHLGCLVW